MYCELISTVVILVNEKKRKIYHNVLKKTKVYLFENKKIGCYLKSKKLGQVIKITDSL